jgi:hypothetical protein
MSRKYRPLTADTTTIEAASLRLLGDVLSEPSSAAHRGDWLRYFLRVMYGADYQRRGARLLQVDQRQLSHMLCTGLRVSRAVMERVSEVYPRRMRRRREELRKLAAVIEAAFSAELMALDSVPLIVRRLSVMASAAANTRQPHSSETGRFVPRVQGKSPALREPGARVKREPRRQK